jgi:dimethylhistidine N-methyltransferase
MQSMETSAAEQRVESPLRSRFRQDVLAGLAGAVKSLPCKYFYDQRGSRLFDEICELDEYYLTRTELAIMRQFAPEMGQQIGPGVMLVEYGSGSSVKTRILLDHLPDPVAYVPVDISGKHLRSTAQTLAVDYRHLEVLPVCADFTEDFALPASSREPTHAAVYFPGSTIGNFRPARALRLLRRIADLCGTGGGLLIGVDLQKDVDVMEAAYNDERGVTAQFNLNLLHRINRELGADFDVEQFEHLAYYNPREGRVEIYIVSRRDQFVTFANREFRFRAGERIHTENSHKYTVEGFAALAAEAGLTLRRCWTDPRRNFAVMHFAVMHFDVAQGQGDDAA